MQQRTQPGFLPRNASDASFTGIILRRFIRHSAVLDSLTPEMLAAWHRERYVPQNAILGIVGDVKASDVIAKLKTALAGWKRTDYKEALPANPKPVTEAKIYLIDRPNSVQSTITMGNIAIDRRHADYIPVVVMNSIVGGGASARLF